MSLSPLTLLLLSLLDIVVTGRSNKVARGEPPPKDWTFTGCAQDGEFISATSFPMVTEQCFIECRDAETFYAGFGYRCFCTSANITINSCTGVEGTTGWVSVFRKTNAQLMDYITSQISNITSSTSQSPVPSSVQTYNTATPTPDVSQTQIQSRTQVSDTANSKDVKQDNLSINSNDEAGDLKVAEVQGRNPMGCFDDTAFPPSLDFMSSKIISISSCSQLCSNFEYIGIQYGGECYCGNNLRAGTMKAPANHCTMACIMEPGLNCGGPFSLLLYNKTT